jgi:hypothetical protein
LYIPFHTALTQQDHDSFFLSCEARINDNLVLMQGLEIDGLGCHCCHQFT